jgi:multimeric flavodoxin WrbA
MKILGLNASHREKSNSGLMLSKALGVCSQKGFDVEQVDLFDKDIRFCTVCDACKGGFKCSLDDDVFPLLEKMAAADGILVSTPTYFGGVCGRLRALFDRSLPLRRSGLMLSGKTGAALAVGGSRNGGQEHTIQQIHLWMLIHEMRVVGDKKTAHFGGIVTAREPESALDDGWGMKTVENTAYNLCETLKKG